MSKKRTVAFIACIIVLAVAVGYLVFHFTKLHENQGIYEELQENVTAGSAAEESDSTYESPIDFEALWEINPDIYAWLEIPDTEIAYPIVQHESDDDYYLNHTIEGVAGYPGSIYTETINEKDFSRFNTVIYGHNMPSGTMFGSLKNYRDETFLNEHREIRIYTPDATRIYRVFAAVVYDDRLLTDAFDDSNYDDRQAFLDSIYSIRDLNSHVLDDVEVTVDSHIITLSTCITNYPNNRYLVEAVLIDEQK